MAVTCISPMKKAQKPLRSFPLRGRYVSGGKELIAPKRSIASSVLVEGGELPLVSVRTKGVIPKNMIFPVMKEIRKTVVKAPVEEGSVLIPDVLGLGIDVIATKRVEKKQG